MEGQTRGQRNVAWIETFCRIPAGPQRGEHVMLSPTQREIVRKLYDHGEVEPITGHLAAYIALLHLCGPEAPRGSAFPPVDVDTFTTWSATSERLRDVLKRDGGTIRCPELGTSFPSRAA